jgi:hypothetical protein
MFTSMCSSAPAVPELLLNDCEVLLNLGSHDDDFPDDDDDEPLDEEGYL